MTDRSNTALLVVAGALCALSIGAAIYLGRPDMSSEPAPLVATEPAQEQQVAVAPSTDEEEATTSKATTTPDAPTIDEVRLEPDGLTIIAGRALAGSRIAVLLDGEEMTSVDVDRSGAFAALTEIAPSTAPRVLSLLQTTEAGETTSQDEVILAPVEQAVAVAEVDKPATPPATDTASVGQPTEEASDNKPAVAPADRIADAEQPPSPPQQSSVALLKSTQQGIELLNPAPEFQDNVAIDTISYGDGGAVQLAGRAQEDAAEVRIYLDNNPIAVIDVDERGRWTGDLPEVDAGVYTLRVDELNAKGDVTSRVETPFKREAPDVLAAATAADPDARSITVQTGATLWAIARDRYGDGALYVQVFEANRDTIRNPDLIYPGQVFALPE
ncbi:MAG: LysM peptidoglycan-binding domain-containing protein [Paracoccaceae bacterium]